MARALALALMPVALAAAPAAAEVKSVADHGFEVASRVTIKAPPDAVWLALGRVGGWWSSAHTYSGDARNMTMPMRVGSCFCETIPDGLGRVEHGRVIFVMPGKMLRLAAALGPLQMEGVSGALTWTLKPVEGGTEVTKNYVVGGYVRSGARGLAPLVDKVIIEQLNRLKAFAETNKD